MRDREDEFQRRKVQIVVVTFESNFLARRYVEDTSLNWPILVDETHEMYRKYGMLTASLWDIWCPKTWWVYLREMMKGAKMIKSEGDISQRGGDVLIDPAGIVSLHHIGAGPADRPPVERLLQRIDRG
ncbi:MAG: peroxiredoxin-like family protein [Candidatus Deferrimicrobium sp.]